jgi:ADP-ribosyl-[dinitrogen reductase] hydrolase
MGDRRLRPVPIPNAYWLPGTRILAGEYPGSGDAGTTSERLELFLDAGITSFVNLTTEGELEPYERHLRRLGASRGIEVRHHRLPVTDVSVPSPEDMNRILDLIEQEHAAGGTVYVHCWGGIGRTGTVVGCWFVREGLDGNAALARLAQLWCTVEKCDWSPQSPETNQQRAFVRDWPQREAGRLAALRHAPDGTRRRREFYRGCLLGGGVGDALGAPVEFQSLDQIRHAFGPGGIADFAPAYGRLGAITDDTQMSLFTAEGLLRAVCRDNHKGLCDPGDVLHHAYARWLATQGERSRCAWDPAKFDGWLIRLPALRSRRAPGNTCLSSLQLELPGSVQRPANNSKGCGGVMRAAPAGMIRWGDPFELGRDLAAITHGHPTGSLAAGCLALLVHEILEGRSLPEAVATTLGRLTRQPHHQECLAAIDAAAAAWQSGAPPSAETVERLGKGWVAEEALAIGLYSALAAGEDFAAGVRLAVNHGGDSDSTGAIAGNLLGALLGAHAIPKPWLEALELRDEITALADDLLTRFRADAEWGDRYPGW